MTRLRVMELFDIGVNLAKPHFDRDRDQVVARAERAGVTRMALTGVDGPGSAASADLAARLGFVSTAGVHPHHAERWDEDAPLVRALLARPEVRAVGECGLDLERAYAPRDAQIRAFEAQLRLAADLGLPLFLHQRGAEALFCRMLAAMGRDLPRATLHCFTGGEALLETCLELGLSFGVTGWICDERRNAELVRLIGRIPAGRLMLETDAPYLFPRSMPRTDAGGPRRARNEPANLVWIAQETARLRGERPEALAAATFAAAEAFFAPSGPAAPQPRNHEEEAR
ncbi:TatD family hydrolase [Oceanicella actignis]|nr:TatD family hydrolase [Oceanicella actignis]